MSHSANKIFSLYVWEVFCFFTLLTWRECKYFIFHLKGKGPQDYFLLNLGCNNTYSREGAMRVNKNCTLCLGQFRYLEMDIFLNFIQGMGVP